jgi:hypothetical protein
MYLAGEYPAYAHTPGCNTALRAAHVIMSDIAAGVPHTRRAEPSDVGLTVFPKGMTGRTTVTHCVACLDVRLTCDGKPVGPPRHVEVFRDYVTEAARELRAVIYPESELDIHTRLHGVDMSDDAAWLTRCVIVAAREVDR